MQYEAEQRVEKTSEDLNAKRDPVGFSGKQEIAREERSPGTCIGASPATSVLNFFVNFAAFLCVLCGQDLLISTGGRTKASNRKGARRKSRKFAKQFKFAKIRLDEQL
jgi:hypothetical protein